MQLRDLYQSVIVDNALHPQHQAPLRGPRRKVTLFNTSCGDQITLAGQFADQHLQQINFKATGCIISRASANMMSNCCLHRTQSQIVNLVTNFSELMTSEPVKAPKKLGDAMALRSVAQLPTRIKCAMLPWKAVYQLSCQNEVK